MPSISSGGFIYPSPWGWGRIDPGTTGMATLGPIDAAGEKIAFVGRIFIQGRAPSKVVSATTGKISFRTASLSVADVGTIIGIGIQDIDATGVANIRPDGVFDVSATITGSTVPLSSNAWTQITMSSGAKTISHGELYAVVVDMSARGATDILNIASITKDGARNHIPTSTQFAAGVWTLQIDLPNCLIETDDGSLAWFAGGSAFSDINSHSLTAGSANDEFGMRFHLPWTATIDGIGYSLGNGASTADHTVILYSAPNTTPATVTSIAVEGGTAINAAYSSFIPLRDSVTLTSSTTYFISILRTGTFVSLVNQDFSTAAHKETFPAGSALAYGARSNAGGGAFSIVETSVPAGFYVRISEIPAAGGATVTVTTTTTITVGAAAGMVVHPGMTGGVKG